MKDNISITVPMDYNALTRTADMLNALAHDLEPKITVTVGGKQIDEISLKPVDVNKESDDASAVFNKKVVPLHPDNIGNGDNTSLEGAENMGNAPPPPASQAAPVGVELDSDGLPWDARIDGEKKLKLAKTQTWKKKRGVDPEFVKTVQAELRAAMNAGKTEIPAPPPHPASTVTTAPTALEAVKLAEAALAPVPPAPPVGMTFPELMSKITTAMGAGTVTEAMVTLACNNQGMASLALVAVRPDVIPAVDAELFPS